ncbi:MAG: Na+/H+ antiporter NhaA [Phyllobacteriaceae bacterium]|nr:Na+/H+ antiporter NhaA [Phyllobacteriaceae bacterium]
MVRPAASPIQEFLASEAAGGILLMAAAAIALVVANSPLAPAYFDLLGANVLGLTTLHWINDALMAVFFLLVGLEIKREFLDGELSTWPKRVLPAIAALGGMAVPAAIYLGFNSGPSGMTNGWAIPTATDIAFALGVLALLGDRVPSSLKVFLTALAILDDLGAVVVIAVFYSHGLSLWAIAAAGGITIALALLNVFAVRRLWPYLVLGVALWLFMHESGIHATIAGVVLAIAIPLKAADARPLETLEHSLHKPVSFAIVPLFGFANAGVALGGAGALTHPVTLGVAAGLFFGKQAGVFATTALALALGWGERPRGATWTQIYGVSLLTGIGFTMSLFIGALAFPDAGSLGDAVKTGVLAGSVLSALAGAALLVTSSRVGRET